MKKAPALVTLLFSLLAGVSAHAQTPAPAKYRVCMDVGHQQRFWRDPADMPGMDVKMIERLKYMTGELVKTGRPHYRQELENLISRREDGHQWLSVLLQ